LSDIVCYRRHGHNEGDDPKFTQPHLYALIDQHPKPREVYAQFLLDHGEPDAKEMAKDMEKKFWADLQERLDEVKTEPASLYLPGTRPVVAKASARPTPSDFDQSPNTAIPEADFKKIFEAIMAWPRILQTPAQSGKIAAG